MRRLLWPVALAAVLASGCGGDDEHRSRPVPEGGSSFGARPARAATGETLLAALAPILADEDDAATSGSSVGAPERARPKPGRVLGLSPERAAARLLLVGFRGTTTNAPVFARLRVRDLGGIALGPGNYVDDAQLAALAAEAGAVARKAKHSPPLMVGAGVPGDPARLPALGVGMALGPVADLAYTGGPHEEDGPSDDPREAANTIAREVSGLSRAGLATAVGHFPGEGAASGDPVLGASTVGLSVGELRRSDIVPFSRVAHSAPAVQLSGALYAGFDGVTPATLLPETTRLLRGLGFKGLVVSADLTTAAADAQLSVGAAAVQALRAGNDLLYVAGDTAAQEDAFRAVAGALRRGRVPLARVAGALRRAAALRRAHAR